MVPSPATSSCCDAGNCGANAVPWPVRDFHRVAWPPPSIVRPVGSEEPTTSPRALMPEAREFGRPPTGWSNITAYDGGVAAWAGCAASTLPPTTSAPVAHMVRNRFIGSPPPLVGIRVNAYGWG